VYIEGRDTCTYLYRKFQVVLEKKNLETLDTGLLVLESKSVWYKRFLFVILANLYPFDSRHDTARPLLPSLTGHSRGELSRRRDRHHLGLFMEDVLKKKKSPQQPFPPIYRFCRNLASL